MEYIGGDYSNANDNSAGRLASVFILISANFLISYSNRITDKVPQGSFVVSYCII